MRARAAVLAEVRDYPIPEPAPGVRVPPTEPHGGRHGAAGREHCFLHSLRSAGIMSSRHGGPELPGTSGSSVMVTRDDVAKLARVLGYGVHVVNNGPRPVSGGDTTPRIASD